MQRHSPSKDLEQLCNSIVVFSLIYETRSEKIWLKNIMHY